MGCPGVEVEEGGEHVRERPFHPNCGKIVKCDECFNYDLYIELRERILGNQTKMWNEHRKTQGSKDVYEPAEHYTCDDCPSVMECKYAFDDYNTNGDCLASK